MSILHPTEVELAIELRAVLQDTYQREFGWLLTGMRYRVEHKDSEYREETQKRVDAAVQGLLLVYLFAIFDEFTTDSMRGEWITGDEKTRLLAYRHVRNSAAHGPAGKRAQEGRGRSEFEDIMNSSEPLRGLVWDKSSDTIDLTTSQVAHDCQQMMDDLAQKLAARLANNKKP